MREFNNAQCEFHYRESVFKRHKEWIIFSAELTMEPGDAAALRETADKILGIRNKKYPPTMKCAGSIFKNFLLAELPARVASEIPAERRSSRARFRPPGFWIRRARRGCGAGDIQVADYHANLIYNAGSGTARDLVAIIAELKQRVEAPVGNPARRRSAVCRFCPGRNRRSGNCHNLKMQMRALTRFSALLTIAVSLAVGRGYAHRREPAAALYRSAAAAPRLTPKRRTCR